MKRELLTLLNELRRSGTPVALVTRLSDGEQAVITDDSMQGPLSPDGQSIAVIRRRLKEDNSGRLDDGELFVQVINRPLRLLLVGAVHISQALIPIAMIAGYEVTVIDPRTAFATDTRFPSVRLITDWPDAAIRELAPDQRTAVVTLTHDPKLDDPALKEALATEAFFIGSLGSRKTHAARVQRLRDDGIGEDAIKRIHGPVGLPLGARRPAEIAISVMAQITQVLRQGEPGAAPVSG